MNSQWAALFKTKKTTSHKTKPLESHSSLESRSSLEKRKQIYFVCLTCLKNHKPFMQCKMTRNNTSSITRHDERHHTDGSKSWFVQSDSTDAQKFIKKLEASSDKLQNEMTVGENISTTSGLSNCSKSSNMNPGQSTYKGSEANSCPGHPDKPKNTEDEPPSKMPKIIPTNSGLSTLRINEQQPKKQSCISIQKGLNTAMSNAEPNMENMMSMLERILISVDANRKTASAHVPVNVQSDPDFRKYDFKSYSDISEIAANVEDIVFIPAGII